MIYKSLYRLTIAALMLCAGLSAGATIPPGYYNSLEGKSGQALKDAVHALARQHTVFSYNSLWIYFAQTDCQPDDNRKVWDMYSNRTYYFRGGTSGVSGMHKEHSLPKSWWGGYDETQGYAGYTDINHLYPSDGDANMAKSNYPLGEVSSTTFDNGVTKVGSP